MSYGRSVALGSEARYPEMAASQLVFGVGLGSASPRPGRLVAELAGGVGAGSCRTEWSGPGCRTDPMAGSGRTFPLFEQSGFDGEARPLKQLQC